MATGSARQRLDEVAHRAGRGITGVVPAGEGGDEHRRSQGRPGGPLDVLHRAHATGTADPGGLPAPAPPAGGGPGAARAACTSPVTRVRQLLLGLLGDVGPTAVAPLVLADPVGQGGAHPVEPVLPHARAQVQVHGGDGRGPGVDAGVDHGGELVVAVGQARQDRRHQHPARDAGVVQPGHRLHPPARVGRAGLGEPPHLVVEGADRQAGRDRSCGRPPPPAGRGRAG